MHAEAAMGSEQQKLLWEIARYSHDQFMWQFACEHSQDQPGASSSSKRKHPTTMEELIGASDADTEPPSNPDEPVDKPVDDTVGEPVDEPEAEPVDKPVDKPVDEPKVTPSPPVEYKVPALVPNSAIPEYAWANWNDPIALLKEEELAEKHDIPNKK